jgi:predicted nuclease with RNAse H fold
VALTEEEKISDVVVSVRCLEAVHLDRPVSLAEPRNLRRDELSNKRRTRVALFPNNELEVWLLGRVVNVRQAFGGQADVE